MPAFVGNATPTSLSCACFFYLAGSCGAALQHRQSYRSAYSRALCPVLLQGRWERNRAAREASALLPKSSKSAPEICALRSWRGSAQWEPGPGDSCSAGGLALGSPLSL